MKAANAKKSRALGIALLALGLAALACAIVFNIKKYYPFGAKSWIPGAVTGVLILVGAILTFRETYARMAFAKKTGLWGVIFLLPWILGFGLFFLIPMARELIFSFENVSIRPTGGLDEEFVKLTNYHYILLEHPTYVRQLTETVLEVVLYTALIIVFSLLCAILLNGEFFGRSAARAIFFVPIVMATGLMIERVSNTEGLLMAQSQEESVYGAAIISRLLFSLGVGTDVVGYLANAVNDIFNVVSLSGIQILIFLAALQSSPPQLYEVAKIEGATGYETFWKVTVVMVSPMIFTCTIYTLADLFMRSDVVDLVYTIGFKQSRHGMAAAMSCVFILMNVLVICIAALLIRKVVFYYDD